jgi:ribosomal protein S18
MLRRQLYIFYHCLKLQYNFEWLAYYQLVRKMVNERGRIWKEEVVACLKHQRHLAGEIEKKGMISQETDDPAGIPI